MTRASDVITVFVCGAVVTAALVPAPACAQRAQAAVVPGTITVGDVFHAAIRVDLPEGARLIAPDSLALPRDVEPAGRREVRLDTAAAGRQATILFPLAAWRPGTYELPDVTLRVLRDGSQTELTVALPSFTVESVLPADTTGVEPRAAKDVLGGNRVWWPILLALLIALAVAVALYIWWRRRRAALQPAPVLAPSMPPRAAALARLEELRAAGLLERGELKSYYARLTETLRHYSAAVDPAWGVDLTTSELAARLRASLADEDAVALLRLLAGADLVKFARARPDTAAAAADLATARAWIERVGPAEPAEAAAGQPDDRRAA